MVDVWSPCTPRFLRTFPAEKPDLGIFTCCRASHKDVDAIVEFWNVHYSGKDWEMRMTSELLTKYVDNLAVVCFILRFRDDIIGTIFSCPCSIETSYGVSLPKCRIIEGLCIHNDYRKQGLAGKLIAYMDWFTSQREPCVHLWAREESRFTPGIFSTDCARLPYSFRYCRKDTEATNCTRRATEEEFLNIWRRKQFSGNFIRSSLPGSIRGDLDYWICETHLVVVSHTRRYTRTNVPIYEIIFMTCDSLTLNCECSNILNKVCANYDGIMYSTYPKLGKDWITGTSGAHAWYMYNYIPPAFWTCDMFIIREEL